MLTTKVNKLSKDRLASLLCCHVLIGEMLCLNSSLEIFLSIKKNFVSLFYRVYMCVLCMWLNKPVLIHILNE